MSLVQTYIISNTNVLYISNDNGNTYTTSTSFASIFNLDPGTGYIKLYTSEYNREKVFGAGTYIDVGLHENKIVASFDSGATAFEVGGNHADITDENFSLGNYATGQSAKFASASESVIYLVGTKALYKSIDSGYTFNYVATLTNLLGTTPIENYRDINFADSNTGILCVGSNVYKTSDGGTTWTALNSLPVSTKLLSAVIDTTGLIINLTDDTNIYYSNDGGSSWTTTVGIASLAFSRISPYLEDPTILSINAYGDNNIIYHSDDFGATWDIINFFGTNNHFRFFYDTYKTSGVTVSESTASITIDGGLNYTNTQAIAGRTWDAVAASYECGCPPDSTLINGKCVTGEPCCAEGLEGCDCYESDPVACCIELKPCVTDGVTDSIYTNNTLTPGIVDYLGQIIKITGQTACYEVINGIDCETEIAVTVESSFETCYECSPVFMLTACDGSGEDIQSPIFTINPIFADYLGQVVWIDPAGDAKREACYFVGIGDYNADTVTVTDPVESFVDCTKCGYYKLTNCADENDILYSLDSELVDYVDQVGKYNELCYSVEFVVGYGDETFIENPFTEGAYEDCECCTYIPPEPEFKKYTRVIPEPVRAFYRIAQEKCEIDTNVKFAVGWFAEFMKLKQGIHMCVDVDIDKLWIKMKLQEFDMIYDEDICVIEEESAEETCIEPEGWIPFE